MLEAHLEFFPEANEVNPDTYSSIVTSYTQLIEAIIDNRTLLDTFGSTGISTMENHTGDLGIGMSQTIDLSETNIVFEESTNQLLQEALATYGLDDSKDQPTISISLDGAEINQIPIRILSTLGDPKRYSAKEFKAMINVAEQVIEQMLLKPDNFVTWMTAIDPDAREFAQYQPLLNAIVDFGIKTLPINARILSKLVAENIIDPRESIALKHDIHRINEEDSEIEGSPFMGEIYTMELVTDHSLIEINGEVVNRNSVKMTHRVAALFADPTDAGETPGQIGDTRKVTNPDQVESLVKEWGPDSIMSSGTVNINLLTSDTTHISVRHENRSKSEISISTGLQIYTIAYTYTEGEYKVEISDRTGKEVEISNIPVKDKIIITKLLVNAPNYLIRTADDGGQVA